MSVAVVGLIGLAVAATAAVAAWLLKPAPAAVPRPVVQFTIQIDDSLRSLARQAIAVSPDGSTLAIAAGTGILARRLDEVGVTPLRNTDNAGPMAFSPDGNRVRPLDDDARPRAPSQAARPRS